MLKINPKKQALGITLDGRDLRIAHLGRQDGKIVIYSFDQITLPHRLGISEDDEVSVEYEDSGGLGFKSESLSSGGFDNESEDASSVLLNFFSRYPMRDLPLAVNIPEGQAFFQTHKDDFGLKGKTLKKQIWKELNLPADASHEFVTLDLIKSPSGELTSVLFSGNIPLIEALIDLRGFFPGGILKFTLIEPNEIALINLARSTLDFEEDEISVLVYIGREFSSLTLLEGDHPISFVQAIHEGYHSEGVCQTLFSRILLEQEDADQPVIHRIVLAGEIRVTRAYEYFTKQFPEVQVEPIDVGDLDVSLLNNDDLVLFPNYALPIALAWETLEPDNPRFLHLKLIPDSIRKIQKFFQIAWHGVAMLILIFVLMVGMSYRTLVRLSAINNLDHSIKTKQETLDALQSDLSRIGLMQEQIENYESNLRFLDTHIVDPSKWSRLFTKLAEDFENTEDIWMESITSNSSGFNFVGRSLFRKRIPKLSYLLPNADLKRVTRMITENGEMTYQFEITAGVPPAELTAEELAAQGGTTVKQTAGASDGAWAIENTVGSSGTGSLNSATDSLRASGKK